MRKQQPSKKIRRVASRLAAEEFFQRRTRPQTQFRMLDPEPTTPAPQPQQPQTDLPRPGSVLSVEESRAIFARLASGDIKQVRR